MKFSIEPNIEPNIESSIQSSDVANFTIPDSILPGNLILEEMDRRDIHRVVLVVGDSGSHHIAEITSRLREQNSGVVITVIPRSELEDHTLFEREIKLYEDGRFLMPLEVLEPIRRPANLDYEIREILGMMEQAKPEPKHRNHDYTQFNTTKRAWRDQMKLGKGKRR